MEKIIAVILMSIGAIVIVASIGLLFAFPIMWCWNYTLPTLFGIKTITWSQAFCLNFLCGCLIKSTQTNNK